MAETKTEKPDPVEDELEEDEEEESEEEEEPAKEASWRPELTELKSKLSDLSTQVQSLNQRSQEQTTLLQNSQEQNRKIQGDQQTILEKVDRLTPAPSPQKQGDEGQANAVPKARSDVELDGKNIKHDEEKKNSKPQEQKPPQPLAERPPHRRRSM